MPEIRILAQLDEIARGADVEDRREARAAVHEQQAAVRRVAEAASDDVRPTVAPRTYAAQVLVLAQQRDVAVAVSVVDLREARASLVEKNAVVVRVGEFSGDDVRPRCPPVGVHAQLLKAQRETLPARRLKDGSRRNAVVVGHVGLPDAGARMRLDALTITHCAATRARRCSMGHHLECAPGIGQSQASALTGAGMLRFSNSIGLRYPRAEWRRRAL